MNKVQWLAHTITSTPLRHRLMTFRLVGETLALFIGLALLANFLGERVSESLVILVLYLVTLLAQGLVLQRIYIIAHEAAHKKIAPGKLVINDLVGQFFLLPLLVPLQVYRHLHYFHHGFNRRDQQTSALDVFVSPWRITPFIKIVCYLLWYLAVFAGGFFFHSLVSIVIFLFIPTQQAQKISPAFKNWNDRDRVISWTQFLTGVMFHVIVAATCGIQGWLFTLALPMLSFAWIWSLLIYIFHYQF